MLCGRITASYAADVTITVEPMTLADWCGLSSEGGLSSVVFDRVPEAYWELLSRAVIVARTSEQEEAR